MELDKLERLESENKFILDVGLLKCSNDNILPERFNGTTIAKPLDTLDLFTFYGRIFLQTEPYCQASFLIEIKLPQEYPFKEPEITFLDRIYHPIVHESGRICIDWSFTETESYSPRMFVADIIDAIVGMIDNSPNKWYVVNQKCFHEYKNDYPTFYNKALELTLSFGRPRH